MPKRINLYGYGDTGEFDKHNPFYLYRQKWAPEILFEIASANRYELTKYDIALKLSTSPIELDDLLSNMENIGMVSKNQDKYSVSFMVVLENDLPIIDNLSNSIALRLGQKIMIHKQEIQNLASSIKCLDKFGYNRILYHVIGCDIFDGTAFSEFSKRGILSTSKPQYDHRDYILIGFEQNEVVSRIGDELLCSRNCKGASGVDFTSFGDCNGDRQDMFRFIRQVTSHLSDLTPNLNLNSSYIHSLDKHNEHFTQVCAEIVRKALCAEKSDSSFSGEEKDAIQFLEELGYIELDESGSVRVTVPLFDVDDEIVIGNISDYMIELIGTEIESEFSNLRSKMQGLSAVLHGVDEKEIGNGLWHQVLGNINEHLVREGLFSTPELKIGEGRYFQAIYIGNS
ncbi:MAG: DUF4423 domain-containing protein [Candidatus Aegiribacteria sp.]|nr:DUF4423 domain-containing protein [Candidatus Aegiribacteria sp.]